MIEVKIDNKNVIDALDRLSKAAGNPRPAFLKIAERLVDSTKKRFVTSTAPDGSKWQPNSDTTLRMDLHSGNHFKKNGSLKKSGSSYLANKKPLIGKTHSLATEIFKDVDSNGLRIGSRLEYAAMQQFGGTTSSRSMIPGKRIPARPFVGISDSDETMILKTVNDYLRSVID